MSLDIIGASPFLCSANRDKTVKKVVDYKLLNGKRYYKVKWECTWEQEDSLLTAQGLVDQFWGFVNRVKSEDDRIVVQNKPGLDERVKCDDKSENNNHHEESVPCASNVHQDKSTNDNVEYPKQKLQNFHSDDDMIRKTVNLKCVEESMPDDNIPSHPSMVTINPTRQAMQISCTGKDTVNAPGLPQHPSSLFKRSYGMMDYNSEENFNHPHDIIDLKIKRQQINGKIVLDNEERRFQCHVCGMAFKRKDMCRRHLRTHSNDFCYFCAICKKGFIRRYVLVKHLSKDHQTDDQTKIISTKRRRREELKQEQPSMISMQTKGDPHDAESSSIGASKYLDACDNLSIDEEHDYDKKTDNVVVVFKMESDDGKMESAMNSRSYEYSEKDESRCYEYSEKSDYRSYEYSEKDDSRSYEYSENDESRSNEYPGNDDSRSHEYSEKGNTNSYRYHEKDIDADGSCSTNMTNQRQTQMQMQTQIQTEMEAEPPVVTLQCMEASLDSSKVALIPPLNNKVENNSSMKKHYNSHESERSVNDGSCRMVNRNSTSFQENVHNTGAPYNSHITFPARHDIDSSTSTGTPKYVLDEDDNLSIDDEHNYDKRTDNVVVVLDTESDNRNVEPDINSRCYEYSEKGDDTRNYDCRTYKYSGKEKHSSYEYSAKDDSRSYDGFGKDNTNPHRYHEKDIDAGGNCIANQQQTHMQTQMQSQMQTQLQSQTQMQIETPIIKLDCMEATLDDSSKVAAVLSPLNNKVENNSSIKKHSNSHESERSVNEGAYRMVNTNDTSFPENVRNTCAPYNVNITFSGRETDDNQTCQNN